MYVQQKHPLVKSGLAGITAKFIPNVTLACSYHTFIKYGCILNFRKKRKAKYKFIGPRFAELVCTPELKRLDLERVPRVLTASLLVSLARSWSTVYV
jgi:hypothetical protein